VARGRTGEERRVEIQVGGLFGLDLRPTRLFLWLGGRRRGERIVSLGEPPRLSRRPHRRREIVAGPVRVSALGHPLVTLGQTGITIARAARARVAAELPEEPRRRSLR
jgi:hypothetical protein